MSARATQETLDRLTRELADKGLLIAAGWMSYRMMVLPPDASEVQIDECRRAFMAGSQHLFASIMSALGDDDDEPTESDLKKLDLINKELNAFADEMRAKAGRPPR